VNPETGEVFKMVFRSDETQQFESMLNNTDASQALQLAYFALVEKGYNPILQIAGYLTSGDPTYITDHLDYTIRRIERDDLIEELVRLYVLFKQH
jgi:uncharacterized protein (UPF0297 family)